MTSRTPPKPWKPGQSGNPAGRKPGTGEVARLRAAIADHVPSIIQKLVEQAKAGDVQAARLLLERTVAPLKPSEESVAVALTDGSLTQQGQAVFAALSKGSITPSQAAQLLASLGVMAKLVETDELAARVAALEARRRA